MIKPVRIRHVRLDPEIAGKLFLHSMPGRYEPLDTFLAEAHGHEVDLVVCLAAEDELVRLSPDYAFRTQTGTFPVERNTYVIKDYGFPTDMPAFLAFTDELARSLHAGRRVLIHCAAGIGRTGLTAASVLMQLGYPLKEAIETIEKAGSHPEIGAQGIFLRKFEARRAESSADSANP